MGVSGMRNIKIGLAITGILFSTVTGFQYLAFKTYTLVDANQVIEIRTVKTAVAQVLEAAHIELGPFDRVSVPIDARLENSAVVLIERGIKIIIDEGASQREIMTYGKSRVKDVLEQEKIQLDTDDRISPSYEEFLVNDSYITIKRIEKQTKSLEMEVPFPVAFKVSSQLKTGETKVVKTGQPGALKRVIEQTYENGVLIEELLMGEEMVVDPVEEVIEIAEEKFFVTSRGKPYRVKGVYVMRASAYDLSYESTGKVPGDWGYGITKMGTQARPGIVAVDPRIIPLGSHLYIESGDGFRDYGFATAEDTGGAIKGNKIDLFVADHDFAKQFGVRYVKVYILDEPVENAEYKGFGR